MFTKTSTTILLLASLATADIDPYAKLTKPPLAQNGFGYLKPGLMNAIPSVPHTVEAWGSGWIPADCKTLAENNNFSASDVQAYKVQYTDVGFSFAANLMGVIGCGVDVVWIVFWTVARMPTQRRSSPARKHDRYLGSRTRESAVMDPSYYKSSWS